MESRSIDLAKTASIDMMTLNNKVVNMRQVVKRTKVQVINKLCKHISALKKKKGTDEQRAKNLRKAERFVEEIDSIKKLKEDKVSKYALANTVSFKDVSKMSLLAGPRALARLADHPLMEKVVSNFREQHHDWRDLAAFLLVKQTGRRFKTKKQKQKKLSRCVENINASETMTKAYIQERFGKEGLTKAEQRFERKRKRPKSVSKLDSQDADEKNAEKQQKTASDTNSQSGKSVENTELQPDKPVLKKEKDYSFRSVTQSKKNSDLDEARNVEDIKHDATHSEPESDSDFEESNSTENDESGKVSNKSHTSFLNKIKESLSSGDSSDSSSQSSDDEGQINDVKKEHITKVKKSTGSLEKDKAPKKNECVVKELNMEEDGGDSVAKFSSIDSDFASDSESDSATGSEGDSAAGSEGDSAAGSEDENDDSEVQKNTFSNKNNDEDSSEEETTSKHSKRKEKKRKQTPEFLTRANKTTVSDPFFADSDDNSEGTNEDFGLNDELDDNEDNMSDNDFSSGKSKVESVFYNPHFSGKNERIKGSRFERDGGRGRFSRRGGFEMFDNRHRGRGRGRARSGGFSDRTRGTKFQEAGRGWSRPQNEDSTFRRTDTSSQTSYKKRFDAREHTQPQKSFGSFGNQGTALGKGLNVSKGPQEKLHPSWEASKKRKAEQSGIVAFKGNKITFDDD